jgi:hypothetical protein
MDTVSSRLTMPGSPTYGRLQVESPPARSNPRKSAPGGRAPGSVAHFKKSEAFPRPAREQPQSDGLFNNQSRLGSQVRSAPARMLTHRRSPWLLPLIGSRAFSVAAPAES